jgi:hydroxymethylglutaryl-CoA synthase
MAKINKKTADYKLAIFPQVDPRVPAGAGKVLGIKNLFPDLTGAIGDVGGVSPFLCMAGALEQTKPGERLLVASYGSGMATAFSIVANDNIGKKKSPKTRRSTSPRRPMLTILPLRHGNIRRVLQ